MTDVAHTATELAIQLEQVKGERDGALAQVARLERELEHKQGQVDLLRSEPPDAPAPVHELPALVARHSDRRPLDSHIDAYGNEIPA